MKPPAYKPSSGRLHRVQAAGVALTVTALMFFMLPFTQFFGNQADERINLQPVDYADPPPPPQLQEEPDSEEEPEPEPLPELDEIARKYLQNLPSDDHVHQLRNYQQEVRL